MRVFPESALGQAFKVALIFTAGAGVVLTGAAGAVTLSASHQVISDGTDRLLKSVHALADGDLASVKATGLVTGDPLVAPVGGLGSSGPRLPAPDRVGVKVAIASSAKLFGIRMIAWQVSPNGGTLAVTPLTPDLPPSLEGVTSPTRASFAGQSFWLAGATGTHGHYVGAISEDALQSGSKPFVTSGLLSIPVDLAVIFVLALIIGRASAAPIERNRRRQMEFAADASHELRTPLSVIRAEASLALSRPRRAADYRRSIEGIASESEKLSALVDDLLFLARADAERVGDDAQPQDLGRIVAAMAQRLAPVAAARSIDLAVDVDSAVNRTVLAPDGWLERLVSVLLDNACRYTPEAGSVSVSVSGAPGHPRLTVEDSGPGVPPEQRQRIFDRFHRGGGGEGIGLGLAIASAVARRTHGKLEVLDSAGGGALFVATWHHGQSR